MLRIAVYTLLIFTLFGTVYFFAHTTGYPTDKEAIANGKAHFARYCSSCHGLEEEGIGPRLGGITELLPPDALVKFIRNPSQVISEGNERAVSQVARYKQIMPSFEWMEEKIVRDILGYIDHQTKMYHVTPDKGTTSDAGLTGRLVAPVKKSGLKIELEKVIQIPKVEGSSPDLGIVTLRSHPSGDKTFFVSDQNGLIYRVENGKGQVFLDIRKYIRDFQSGPGIATGIGSFDFHPDYLNNGLIYITHAETFKGKKPDYQICDSIKAEVQWVIGEWKVDDVNSKIFSGQHRELMRLHAPTFAHGCQDIGFVPALSKSNPENGL